MFQVKEERTILSLSYVQGWEEKKKKEKRP